MIDQNMFVPSLIIFFSFAIVGMLIQKVSGRKTAQRQRDMWARSGGAPEHGWVDDSASPGATLANIGLCTIGTYIALAMLFFHSNPLWAFTLFH